MKKIRISAIIVFLALVTMVIISVIFSQDKISSEKILDKKLSIEEEYALRTWKDILSVHVFEEDEHLEKIKAEAIIKLMIENFATCLKTGEWDNENILIGGKDIKKAVMLLNQTSPIITDKFVGNWDGRCSVEELNKFINYPETRFQVGIVRKMIIIYSTF